MRREFACATAELRQEFSDALKESVLQNTHRVILPDP